MHRKQQKRHALGSEACLTIVSTDIQHERIFAELWSLIDKFEARFSRFLLTSELTAFNKQSGAAVAISEDFYQLLHTAIDMSVLTNGIYSPFILPMLQEAGYRGSWPHPEIYESRLQFPVVAAIPSPLDIMLTPTCAKIPASTALDFGGIGKGYLLDKLGAYLRTQHIDNFWLSLGGDIICSGVNEADTPWEVLVAAANSDGSVVGQIANETGEVVAIATSGTTKRRAPLNDKQWHHLIDPRTGLPAKTDILTTTVATSTATEADIYAKWLTIVGSAAAKEVVNDHPTLHDIYIQTCIEIIQLRQKEPKT